MDILDDMGVRKLSASFFEKWTTPLNTTLVHTMHIFYMQMIFWIWHSTKENNASISLDYNQVFFGLIQQNKHLDFWENQFLSCAWIVPLSHLKASCR